MGFDHFTLLDNLLLFLPTFQSFERDKMMFKRQKIFNSRPTFSFSNGILLHSHLGHLWIAAASRSPMERASPPFPTSLPSPSRSVLRWPPIRLRRREKKKEFRDSPLTEQGHPPRERGRETRGPEGKFPILYTPRRSYEGDRVNIEKEGGKGGGTRRKKEPKKEALFPALLESSAFAFN